MESTRRLYHTDAEWGHSVAGYVTDYVIFVVSALCIVCAVALLRRKPAEEVRRIYTAFVIYAAFLGVSFLAGGIAHHMIDSYGDEPLGKTWGSVNSGYMYAWLVAVALNPTGLLASLAVVFAVAAFPAWSRYLLYALGAIVGIVEIVVMATEDLSHSGVASGYLALVAYLGGGLLAAGLAVRSACRGVKDWANPFNGRGLIMLGMFVALVGHLVVTFKPASCTKGIIDPDLVDGECPFSEDFNHNAIFHVFVTCAIIIIFVGVKRAVPSAASEKAVPEPVEEVTV